MKDSGKIEGDMVTVSFNGLQELNMKDIMSQINVMDRVH